MGSGDYDEIVLELRALSKIADGLGTLNDRLEALDETLGALRQDLWDIARAVRGEPPAEL